MAVTTPLTVAVMQGRALLLKSFSRTAQEDLLEKNQDAVLKIDINDRATFELLRAD